MNGCKHYKRKCMILSTCCNEWYSCRLCHDEKYLDHHEMNRHILTQMKCMNCNTIQPISNYCNHCKICMGKYFCNICNLFDDEGQKKKIFHCKDCGICRVGGKSNFFHCKKCNGCFSHTSNHKCIEDVMLQGCVVCLDMLHTSRDALVVLSCGHVLHEHCQKELINFRHYCCPICKSRMD